MQAVVIEDRGPIGVNGVRIFSVRVPNDPYDDMVFEMPEDELAPAKNGVQKISEDEIIDYLKHGGLLQILRSDLSGDKNQPRVWLTRDSLGNVVHTYSAERGIVGGGTVPYSALYEYRVSAPKRDEVLAFLSTFGLSKQKAKQVVDSVGTAP